MDDRNTDCRLLPRHDTAGMADDGTRPKGINRRWLALGQMILGIELGQKLNLSVLCSQRPLVFSRRYADIVYPAGHAVRICALAFQQNGYDD